MCLVREVLLAAEEDSGNALPGGGGAVRACGGVWSFLSRRGKTGREEVPAVLLYVVWESIHLVARQRKSSTSEEAELFE